MAYDKERRWPVYAVVGATILAFLAGFITLAFNPRAVEAGDEKIVIMGIPASVMWRVCDEIDQVRDVVEGRAESREEWLRRYNGYVQQKNEAGEPTCGRVQGTIIITERHEVTTTFDGKDLTIIKIVAFPAYEYHTWTSVKVMTQEEYRKHLIEALGEKEA